MAVGRFWLDAAAMSMAPYFARVPSLSNIADGPTRSDLGHMIALGAEFIEPACPEWFSNLWALEEFPLDLWAPVRG